MEQGLAWVDASTKTMQRAGYYVREAIEKNAVDDALRHAAVMLGELRVELLPSAYFSLWTQACGELAALGAFFEACDDYHYDYLSLVRALRIIRDPDGCRWASMLMEVIACAHADRLLLAHHLPRSTRRFSRLVT